MGKCIKDYCGIEFKVDEKDKADTCPDCIQVDRWSASKERHITISLCLVSLFSTLTLISLFTDFQGVTAKYNLFGRMGALLTLCGVILEYNLGRKLSVSAPLKYGKNISFGWVGEAVRRAVGSKEDSHHQLIAHITVVIGTVVWGFGDLINEPIVRTFISNIFC